MYTRDITFLLRLLQTSKQSGVLSVEPPGPPEASWQGLFQLDAGVVKACLIRSKIDGHLLLGNEEALHWLTNQGRLEWHLEEDGQFPGAAPPALQAPEERRRMQRSAEEAPPVVGWSQQLARIPQRTQKGKVVPVNALASRDHRQVFALVDGRRSIEEIVTLLGRPPDIVIRLLQELRAIGLIL